MKILKPIISVLCLIFVSACDDFLVPDISNKQIQIIAPHDKSELPEGAISFRWKHLKDAQGYHFTLISGSFSVPERLVADTLIYADSLSRSIGCKIDLKTDEYFWSIYAFNSGYETRPQIQSLTISSTEKNDEITQ